MAYLVRGNTETITYLRSQWPDELGVKCYSSMPVPRGTSLLGLVGLVLKFVTV